MESVHCENKCGAKMLRKYLNRHMTGDCPKRATKCAHCGKDFNIDILQVRACVFIIVAQLYVAFLLIAIGLLEFDSCVDGVGFFHFVCM